MEENLQSYRKEVAATLKVLRRHIRWKPGDVKMKKKRLLETFCQGVCLPKVSGFEVLELLDVRSALARQEGELNKEARKKLEEADGLFLKNARQFYEAVARVADLEEMRRRAAVSPSHWWWYLEKLARAERAAV
jgi:hypothetical protein